MGLGWWYASILEAFAIDAEAKRLGLLLAPEWLDDHAVGVAALLAVGSVLADFAIAAHAFTVSLRFRASASE